MSNDAIHWIGAIEEINILLFRLMLSLEINYKLVQLLRLASPGDDIEPALTGLPSTSGDDAPSTLDPFLAG